MRDRISHYRLEHEMGRGGMGVVYRAIDTRLGRAVAIKMLPAEATADAERNRRFVQEARSASALNHPHIVTIYDIGDEDGTTFIAMELVDGTPLDRIVEQGPLPIERALDYATQVASALEAAHAGGLVHRDIKPANILITRDGRAKVLDFGLAKLVEAAPGEATRSMVGTTPGLVMGTLAYMSPEQAEGRAVNARSDVFSFGVVLYELLAGRRPFGGTSEIGLITSILRDEPPPLRAARADVPADVQALVERCLTKDAASRYAHGGELRAALAAIQQRRARPADSAWRRPRVLIPAALILVAAAGAGVWQTLETRRGRWVEQALPEIERLQQAGAGIAAVRLARDVEPYAPDSVARIRESWFATRLTSDPEGAEVHVRPYLDLDGPWEPLGTTPLRQRLPFGYYRVRITKPGFVPVEVSMGAPGHPPVRLAPEPAAEPRMVLVLGGPYSAGVAGTVTLPDFWIGRYEVTNREFKAFVDAGGYRDSKFWTNALDDNGASLTFEEAIDRFRDATGQPGPATWELGTYPEGQEDFPVGGISWYEADAYARFAGATLPTVYHWNRAANVDNELSSDILQLSNLESMGPTPAGAHQGLGPWGTLDMAGNVKEWCANQVEGSDRRYILGGGWNEPRYRFHEADARTPLTRDPTFGVRIVKDLGPTPEAHRPVKAMYGDPRTVVPIAEQLLEPYLRFYAYDRTPLDARLVAEDDNSPYWTKQTISFRAAYGDEQVPAYLFLPKTTHPPYQTVVLYPTGYALQAPSSAQLDHPNFEFIIRSGRAVLYPVYQGTFERRAREAPGPTAYRDRLVHSAKDLFRAVDYLETRSDIDATRLAYYSLSMGAFFGPIPVALEPRLKAAVFASGGLRYNHPPEIQPANFAPRVKVPVLLVFGRDDFQTPPEAQRHLFELIGTSDEHKRMVVLDGGHVPNDRLGFMREVLAWFDQHLGPVR